MMIANAVMDAAPYIVAAYAKKVLDTAFPSEDADYLYGCEAAVEYLNGTVESNGTLE